MKKVYAAQTLLEAQMVADGLRAAGIDVHVRGATLAGVVGELPVTETYPDVCVMDPDDVAAAETWLRRWRADKAQTRADWPCPECGEVNPGSFDQCWNCGALR